MSDPGGRIDVSVIIPAYNRPEFLPACLESVVNQDRAIPIEVLCVDDGSPNDPFARLPKPMPDHVYLLRKSHAGVSAARRYAYERTKGRYIAFNDDDDLWLPGRLKTQLEFLERHPEIDMVFGDLQAFTEAGDDPETYYYPHRPTLTRLGKRMTLGDPPFYRYTPGKLIGPFMSNMTMFFQTVLVRRELIETIGGIDPFARSAAECTDFALRTAYFGRLAYLDQPTFRLRRGHAHQIARPYWLERELKEFGLMYLRYPKKLRQALAPWMGYRLANKGWRHFHHGDYRAAAEAYREAARWGPIGSRFRLKWALSLLLAMVGGRSEEGDHARFRRKV